MSSEAVLEAKAMPTGNVSSPSESSKPDNYLRVSISDAGSTVIQVNDSMTLHDILLATCAKRGLAASSLKVAIVYRNGSEDSGVDQGQTIGQFKDVDSIKIVGKETGKYVASSVVNLNSGGNMGSSEGLNMTSKGKGKEEGKSGMLSKTMGAGAFSTSQSNLMGAAGTDIASPKGKSPNMFRKITGGAEFVGNMFGRVEISPAKDTSSDKLNASTKSFLASSQGQHASISSHTSSSVLPEIETTRPSKVSQTQSQTSQSQMQSFHLPSRQGSFSLTTNQSQISFNSTLDKLERDSNATKPAFLAKEGVALKKLSPRTRSRANTDGIQEITKRSSVDTATLTANDKPDKTYLNLIVTLPNFRSITIRAPNDLPMDAILSYICEQHKIEFEGHTFHRNDGKETLVEMDRTVGYFVTELKVEEVFIVPEEKIYRSSYLTEDGLDVMMFQTIQGRPLVMAGTPQKLIARLTDVEGKDDHAFIETFLLTFRYFMPAEECFKHIVSRFNCVPPENATPEDVEYYNKMKGPIQECVANILELWARGHWHDFALSSELKSNLEHFAMEFMYNDELKIRQRAPVLLDVVEKQTVKYDEMYSYYKMVERKGKVLESMFLELTPEVLSHQICIHNFKLFKNIHPIEFLHQIWGSDREMTPYLNFFIDRFDKESYWVATEIVMQKDLKKRIKILANFILTTKACQEANNFFSLFSLMSGLGLSPVSRLKKTWEGLPEKAKTAYEELEKIIDPSRNMKNYRDLLAKAVPPIVPFLPIYLKDLTFMNDGNAKMVEGMINFEKLRMMGNRVKDIVSLVAVEYKGDAQPHIQNYIAKPPVEKNMAKLKEMSLECEKAAS
ncbi:ras guanine nucleotide exchange factor domain-containing protein [Obelidium mucronatum]|nr:ras guanine nucleotide exchange factor domain-containing protein [Obelidium mucronatum]